MKETKPISITHKELIDREWMFEKNTSIGLFPDKITRGNHKKAWFICPEGHESFVSIKSKCCLNSKCRECYNINRGTILRKIKAKKNSILEFAPQHIKDEWDFEENEKLGFYQHEVSCGSRCLIPWKCSSCGHKWKASPSNRIHLESGCPACSGNVVVYENSIEFLCPELLEEWDYERNVLKPSEISPGSTKEIHLKCKKYPEDHPYSVPANSKIRIKDGIYVFSGCSYCTARKVNHSNHLFITHPHLEKEWDFTKNTLNPRTLRFGTKKMAWFICPEGHSYETMISNKTVNASGCPDCRNLISQGHKDLISIIEHYKTFLGEIMINDRTTIRNPKTKLPLELDIYLPEKKIAFEFNGSYYHSAEFNQDAEERHRLKTELCEEQGIKLYHIDEQDFLTYPEKYEDLIRTFRS